MALHNAISKEEIYALENKLYTKSEFIIKFNRHPATVYRWFNQ
jgi:predicted secreted protein